MVGGVRDPLLTIDLGEAGSVIDLGAFFKHHVGPPPPTIKGRTVGGVWNLLWTIRLHADGMTVDLSTNFKHLLDPPPPTVKGQTIGGVQKSFPSICALVGEP
jgi:hypothetical protein